MEKVLAFMHASSVTSSLLLLASIALDRHLHASKRQCYLNYTSNRFAITASISVYLFGMTMAVMRFFQNRAIQILGLISSVVIGKFSFTFICLKSKKIVRIVQNHLKQMELNCRGVLDQAAYSRAKTLERSVNRSVFSIIIVFFAAWTSILIVLTIFAVHIFLNKPIEDDYRIATSWTAIPSYLNGALNSIIYSYRCDAIGREIRRIVGRIAQRGRTTPSVIEVALQRQVVVLQDAVKSSEANSNTA